MKEAEAFFSYSNERERVRILKESGAPRPWTDDPVLNEFRFCNIFREDDRTTRAFRETVREPLREDPRVLIATIAWRWFNRIETCERISCRTWAEGDTATMREALDGLYPIVTGAYMIKSPTGMNKLEGLLLNIDTAKEHVPAILEACTSLESAHAALLKVPFLGPFLAYELVTDLRHTALLDTAPDINTWASAGPGAIRGLGWLVASDPGTFRYGGRKNQAEANTMMQQLLEQSRSLWAYPDRPWEMREVEHTLCEYDKLRRAQGGQTLKRRFECE